MRQRAVSITVSLCVLSQLALAQQSPTELYGPQLAVDAPIVVPLPASLETERIRAVTPLGGSLVAVADAGASTVYIISPRGDEICRMGSRGQGPGQFADITAIWRTTSQVLVFDGITSRVTAIGLDCSLLASRKTPMLGAVQTQVLAVAGDGTMLLGAPLSSVGGSAGLATQSIQLTTWRGDRLGEPLGEMAFGYRYLVTQERASTAYAVPFLGRLRVAALPGGFAIIAREGRELEIRNSQFRTLRSASLPIAVRTFDRREVSRYRDSLIAQLGPNANARFPGARERIEYAFGAGFPAVPSLATVADLFTNDSLAFVNPAGQTGTTRAWIVVRPSTGTVLGHFNIDAGLRVVGVSPEGLYAVRLDEDDVEQIVLIRVRGARN